MYLLEIVPSIQFIEPNRNLPYVPITQLDSYYANIVLDIVQRELIPDNQQEEVVRLARLGDAIRTGDEDIEDILQPRQQSVLGNLFAPYQVINTAFDNQSLYVWIENKNSNDLTNVIERVNGFKGWNITDIDDFRSLGDRYANIKLSVVAVYRAEYIQIA